MRKSQQQVVLLSMVVVTLLLNCAEGKPSIYGIADHEDVTESTRRNGQDKSAAGKRSLQLEEAEDPIFVECSAEVTRFTSYVAVEFNGDPRDLNCCEIPLLEEGFEVAYSQLTKGRCDEYFRAVEGVELVIAPKRKKPNRKRTKKTYHGYDRVEKRRRTQQTQSNNSTAVPDGSSFFTTVGQCRGCATGGSGSSNLFDDGFRRRRRRRSLAEEQEYRRRKSFMDEEHDDEKQQQSRNFNKYYEPPTNVLRQEPTETCTCPPGSVDFNPSRYGYYHEPKIGPDAPSIEEFRRVFNQYIDMLSDEGMLENVGGIDKLEEYTMGPGGGI